MYSHSIQIQYIFQHSPRMLLSSIQARGTLLLPQLWHIVSGDKERWRAKPTFSPIMNFKIDVMYVHTGACVRACVPCVFVCVCSCVRWYVWKEMKNCVNVNFLRNLRYQLAMFTILIIQKIYWGFPMPEQLIGLVD